MSRSAFLNRLVCRKESKKKKKKKNGSQSEGAILRRQRGAAPIVDRTSALRIECPLIARIIKKLMHPPRGKPAIAVPWCMKISRVGV